MNTNFKIGTKNYALKYVRKMSEKEVLKMKFLDIDIDKHVYNFKNSGKLASNQIISIFNNINQK